jgi:hypothetical protein
MKHYERKGGIEMTKNNEVSPRLQRYIDALKEGAREREELGYMTLFTEMYIKDCFENIAVPVGNIEWLERWYGEL